jgi:hypothetical protein
MAEAGTSLGANMAVNADLSVETLGCVAYQHDRPGGVMRAK